MLTVSPIYHPVNVAKGTQATQAHAGVYKYSKALQSSTTMKLPLALLIATVIAVPGVLPEGPTHLLLKSFKINLYKAIHGGVQILDVKFDTFVDKLIETQTEKIKKALESHVDPKTVKGRLIEMVQSTLEIVLGDVLTAEGIKHIEDKIQVLTKNAGTKIEKVVDSIVDVIVAKGETAIVHHVTSTSIPTISASLPSTINSAKSSAPYAYTSHGTLVASPQSAHSAPTPFFKKTLAKRNLDLAELAGALDKAELFETTDALGESGIQSETLTTTSSWASYSVISYLSTHTATPLYEDYLTPTLSPETGYLYPTETTSVGSQYYTQITACGKVYSTEATASSVYKYGQTPILSGASAMKIFGGLGLVLLVV